MPHAATRNRAATNMYKLTEHAARVQPATLHIRSNTKQRLRPSLKRIRDKKSLVWRHMGFKTINFTGLYNVWLVRLFFRLTAKINIYIIIIIYIYSIDLHVMWQMDTVTSISSQFIGRGVKKCVSNSYHRSYWHCWLTLWKSMFLRNAMLFYFSWHHLKKSQRFRNSGKYA